MPCEGASYCPSQEMLNRCSRGTSSVGTETGTLACPFHISVSSSWATTEFRKKISRGKQGVCSVHTRTKCTTEGVKHDWDKPCHADSMSSAPFLESHQGCRFCSELERPKTKPIIWQNRVLNYKKEIRRSILPLDTWIRIYVYIE